MSNKYLDGTDPNSIEETMKYSSTMIDDKLFDEEDNVVHKLINIKRVSLPQGGEDWEVLEDGKVVLVVKGIRLTKKQKSVLRTADGLNMLIAEYKAGNKAITYIKKKLNDHWKSNNDTV
jgi:hypothetical protein